MLAEVSHVDDVESLFSRTDEEGKYFLIKAWHLLHPEFRDVGRIRVIDLSEDHPFVND